MIAQATDTSVWIHQTCQRLADAIGWPVRFVPRDETDNADESTDCWSMKILNGDFIAGKLKIDLPTDTRRDRAFLAVCELAEMTGELIGEVLTARSTLERRTSDVSTLVDVGLSIANDAKPHDSLDRLLTAAVELTYFRAAAFFLIDPAVNSVNLRGVAGIDGDSIPQTRRPLEAGTPDLTALANGQVLVRSDKSKNGDRWLPNEMSVGLCVAVQSEAGPLGTLWVYDRRLRMPEKREEAAIESIVAQLATVLERVVLLRESESQHRMQRDLQSASESQPDAASSGFSKHCGGADFAALCASRYELGGDLCEVISIDENRTAIAVGDASGDSVPAAMVMSAVRGSLRTLTSDSLGEITDTATVIQRMNRTLHQITPAHQFMSFVYGVFDATDNSFAYSNAGHPPPLWFSGRRCLALESHGLLLGVDADTTYDHSKIHLKPNDMLVMFSDGITEAKNADRQLFGTEGIVRAVSGSSDCEPEEVLRAVSSHVECHTAGTGDSDDRTLLVIRIRP
ncbi:MAG: SpoIIE family protein phosphatase [Planctomycetaceae bacterium]|jgi:phosphoserine phosphatase RsbU/P|nr:SpoIIE family protein phosphatase [Planctomycetaceae bacterium]MBT6153398.1 SpoIIE family protein phosphatase [Planctomycetaceae bacterium]MBT6484047.1 SpoIIE family protein phosphatase [Planctomycetaceae bacterium]MBT6496846.1 SpoIIE family protein phosphatase [Planctomycetaceae bacterium]